MSIYGISDLHLDFSGEKPMDIFGDNWLDHEVKIFENWKRIIKEEDLVLVSGDVSWAMKLEDAYIDLLKIDRLPGIKVITKGNHDYWWSTKSKLKGLKFNTIHFLQNDYFLYKNIGICGTRGWISRDSDEFKEKDEKIFNRELNRLKLSLESIKEDVKEVIVMLHYPPFNIDGTPNEFVEIMNKYNVSTCVYGHLHGEGHKFAVEGKIDGIKFYCISCDFIDFSPKKLL
ncbi:metallophosphoesterase [Caloranaerobacter azorensis]|uniref:Serine/threonine protein phosphatase n=1 Tax=Caloranaerobacter azorensis TaxID=116090 RepID=A0A6P1YC98_9FIRM|nr:metallophosphoesterase [Caloranaerobacter azorensis]QIB26821.1 serine/threonine protein phosphatase [Caloranaerobacter azorensis]